MSEADPLRFPCEFPIKVVGVGVETFAQTVLDIVTRHAPDFAPEGVQLRPSASGSYLAVTCVITARSRAQLDGLYRELSAHPLVRFVL